MFTILIMSFHSRHLIVPLIESIDRKIPIVVLENSQDYELKNLIEKKYDNVKFIIPERNLGFAKGANLAINQIDAEYIFLNPADVFLPKKCIDELIECMSSFNNFAMLAPTYKDEAVYRNYEHYSKFPVVNNSMEKKFGVKEVDIIDGTFILKKSEFKNIGLFDENIFIYFEPWDLSKRVTLAGKKMFVCEKIKFEHLGGQSHDPKYNFQAKLSRNWHYCWSKFYYIRKYSNYFYAFKKTVPILFKSIIKCAKCRFKNDKEQYQIHMAEIKGLISAYLFKKSNYRPYETHK